VSRRLLAVAVLAGAFGLLAGSTASSALDVAKNPRPMSASDVCAAPPSDPAPGTAEWRDREVVNLDCMRQGSEDALANPEYVAAFDAMRTEWAQEPGHGAEVRGDPLRHPATRWDGVRGRHQQVWIATLGGGRMSAELFAPLGPCRGKCPRLPQGLRREQPPYPVIVLLHGGGAAKEMFWNTAEVVAEHGYLVLVVDANFDPIAGGKPPDPPPDEPGFLFAARNALDYALATPERETAAGEHNPWWKLAETERVGLIGSSLGAVTLDYLGQIDERVDTIVAYDSCEYVLEALGAAGPDVSSISPNGGGCRSRPAPLTPEQLRTSRLGFNADYHTPADTPRSSPPDPHHKDEYTRALVAQGIDAMQVAVRASAHADVADDQPGATRATSQSRHGQAAMNYYTLAWLDYQLRGGELAARVRACRRLTASTFDDFADAYQIGTGRYEPRIGNVPETIGGLPVPARLSYLFASSLFLDNGNVNVADLHVTTPRSACTKLS